MKYYSLAAIAISLIVPTIASAQLAITFTPDTKNLTTGSTTTYQATLENLGNTALSLVGISNNVHPDLIFDDTDFFALNPIIPANTTLTSQSLFTIMLKSSPSETVPFLYNQNSITVEYTQNSITSFSPKSFNVQSQTPTPPVILVTLLSGIGTARMALRRRKKA